MKFLYGDKFRKDYTEKNKCKSEYWMRTEYGERALEGRKSPNRENIVQLKQDEGLEC